MIDADKVAHVQVGNNLEHALLVLTINDIETGTKNVDSLTYKKLVTLYDRVRSEN
ncbi:antirepressor AbbA [Bacillus licheniformis]|nr:antirepressor AbbA [Bacillus licheniformis]